MNGIKSKVTRLLSLILLIAVVFACVSSCAERPLYYGKTVILHTNDVHGALEGYSYLATQKAYYENNGAKVFLLDAGDYFSGSMYLSEGKGENAITMMNSVGYDVATIGNHEFDYGVEILKDRLSKATFNVICSNVFSNGELLFDENAVLKSGKVKIGIFALDTPETTSKVNPNHVKNLEFSFGEELYNIAQQQVDALNKKCDLVICLAHLGVDDSSTGYRSIDVMDKVNGIDFMIDAHSHTVMTEGPNGEIIQSTGTKFSNIGVIIIDNKTKAIEEHFLLNTEELEQDKDILKQAQDIIANVDAKYNKAIANSEVFMTGDKSINRTQESTLGDLVNDAFLSYIKKNVDLAIDDDHIVAITNGGGIRADLNIGDVSMSDIKNIVPFGNTLSVNFVKGSTILEVLEASTYSCPASVGGFPQIAGLNITIDTTINYDGGELYPNSTYQKPNSINRVTINDINGKPFVADDVYVVITNNFCSSGGDTYYALAESFNSGNGFDTSIVLEDVIVDYLINDLGGVIGSQYAQTQGRITIK